jgi:hypothetical protein
MISSNIPRYSVFPTIDDGSLNDGCVTLTTALI